jgi:glycosyltransferase involved in cell wall biosynthesis
LTIKKADAVISVSDSIADEYAKNYGIRKPSLVLNTPYLTRIEKKDYFRKRFALSSDTRIFLYQGGLSRGRGIEILIDAFSAVEPNSVIVFMGYGPLEQMVRAKAEEHSRIFFHEAVSPAVLLDYTCSADYGILFYENTCLNHYYCSPNKMFEYIMAELPVIVSNLYEMKRIVQSCGIGVVAKENTSTSLGEAVNLIATLDCETMKRNIVDLKLKYNWEEQEKELLRVYNDL